MNCIIAGGVCSRCGKPARHERVLRNCRGRPGLGDVVEKALSAIGITKKRVARLTGKPCGCRKRQEAMNAWGYRWQDRLLATYRYAMYRIETTSRWLRYSRLTIAVSHFRNGIRVLLTGRN